MKCIVLRGVPGVGKSTYAATLGGEVVNADRYFMVNGVYRFDFNKLGEAHAKCFKSFMNFARWMHDDIIVDNTNITSVEIAPYMLGAAAFGYEAEVHDCHPVNGIESIVGRNIHGVSEAAVRSKYQAQVNEKLPTWWKFVQVELP